MQKKDVDNIVEALLKEEWRGETYKDLERNTARDKLSV